MNILEILSAAERLGLTLRAEGESLVVRGPEGAIDPELRRSIRMYKVDLLAALARRTSIATIPPRPSGTVPVLSAGQESLWFLDQWEGAGARYNVQASLRICGPLVPQWLEQALQTLVTRHESLRTSIHDANGTPRAEVVASARPPFRFVDLSKQATHIAVEELRRLSREDGATPFRLDVAPHLRATLVALPSQAHALVLTQHHVSSDGASMGILVQELAALYRALVTEAAPELRPLSIQYADHAAWQRDRLAGPRGAELESFWRTRLEALPRLPLPSPLPTPAVRTGGGAVHRFRFAPSTVSALKALARQQECTLFAGLAASFAALLHRYTEQSDFALGTVVAGRERPEVAGLIGFFVNTVVLRYDASGAPSFADLLARSGRVAREAFEHQDLPFDAVVKLTHAERAGELNPLVRACVVLESARPEPLDVCGATWFQVLDAVDGSIEGGAKFDLSLMCVENDGGIDAALEYSTDLYDAPWVARMVKHLVALLEGMLACPEQAIRDVDYLDAAERAWLLDSCNQTAAPVPLLGAHEMFAARAAEDPNAIALVSPDERVTYAELDARANRLANDLVGRGVLQGSLVAIALDPSVDRVVALLAVLKANAAYLPLDADYPLERLAFSLRDSDARLLITSISRADRFPNASLEILLMDEARVQIDAQSAKPPAPAGRPDDLAYVIYTSGSTGTPKGVQIEHRGLSNLVAVLGSTLGLGPGSRMLQIASFAFDASIFEIHAALTSGATLYVAPREHLIPGPDLVAFIVTQHISHALLSASALSVMDPANVPGLTTLATGGEACPPALAEKWSRGRALFNAYGPTEATVCVTVSPWSEHAPGGLSAVPSPTRGSLSSIRT